MDSFFLNIMFQKTLEIPQRGMELIIFIDVRSFAYNVVGRFLCSPTSLGIFTYEKMTPMVDFHDWIDFSYLPNKVSVFSGEFRFMRLFLGFLLYHAI